VGTARGGVWEYLKKGRGVRVVGRLKQDRWTDADGKPHSRIFIVAEHVEFRPQFKKQDRDPASRAADEKEEKAEGKETVAEEQKDEVREAVSF